MASRLKKFLEYQQATAGTSKLLVPLKTKAIILPFVQKPTEQLKKTPILEAPELTEERICILTYDATLPYPWAETVVKLQTMSRPANIPLSAWSDIQLACSQLYRDNFGLLKLMINHDWSLHDIYGCNLQTPMFRFDAMGLLMLLHAGDEVVGVNAERIKILHKSGTKTCLKKRLVEPTEENLLFKLNVK